MVEASAEVLRLQHLKVLWVAQDDKEEARNESVHWAASGIHARENVD